MKQLISLELSKFKLRKYLIASVLITIGICVFTMISLFASEQGNAADFTDSIKLVTSGVVDCYLIFAGVIASKIIVEEYVNGTVSILFTYTVSRRKIIIAKVTLVLLISLILSAITNVVSVIFLNVVKPYLQLALNDFSWSDFLYWSTQFVWDILLTISLVLLICSAALFKKTSQFTYVMSLVALLIAQMIISQDMQIFTLVLLPLSVLVVNIAIKNYGCDLER